MFEPVCPVGRAASDSQRESTSRLPVPFTVPNGNTVDGPEKDNEFWFDDGNIILIAGNPQFRVYQGPLIRHSPVFRDMLSLVQPEVETGCAKAIRTIPLTDSALDIRHLDGLIFGNVLRCVSSFHGRSASDIAIIAGIRPLSQSSFLSRCYSDNFYTAYYPLASVNRGSVPEYLRRSHPREANI